MSSTSENPHHYSTYDPRAHEWRTIPEHPDYAIRDDGLIASLKRHPRRPRFLKLSHDARGYAVVTLDNTRYFVHHLIARIFLGAPPGAIVRFKTANRYDLRAANLHWELPIASPSID